MEKRINHPGGGHSRTLQSQANQADINTIMARYHRTGILGSPDALQRQQAAFADVSQIGDFREVCDRIHAANEQFMRLPADVRFYFRNDPAELIEFIQNPQNRKKAEELGLLKVVPVPPLDNTGTTDTTPQAGQTTTQKSEVKNA